MIHTLELSTNTAGQNVKRCRQILNQAVNDRLIEQNPFRGVRIDLKSDKTKNRFIDGPTSKAILEACPNQEWRVIFALARFGGLRCPSEVLAFDGRTSIGSVIASRFDRRKLRDMGRVSGLFRFWQDVRTELNTWFDIVQPGNQSPLGLLRRSTVPIDGKESENPIASDSGCGWGGKWPKPFMALRSSRRTELERAGFKNHVLNDWFGHTGAIAEAHYLQTTEADFEAAMTEIGATGDSVAHW